MSYDNVTKFWRLDSPSQCRDFIKSARLDGKQITTLTTESGKEISVDDASDEQVMEVAGWMAKAIEKAKKGH